jgi:choline-glycine betaine transporter
VAVGLFVYGVAEPLWHQNSHFYANAGYHSQDEIDMFALNMTITDWAIGAWAPYLVVAVGMGLAGFRFNLPMTFRSCFYPILGSYTWGWIGDVIDGFAIVVTVAGVCTSLGLGAIQMVAGFKSLGWVDEDASEDTLQNVQILTIWGVTVIATISVMSGLHAGVKFLSQLALALGMVLTMLVFIMDDSKFLLNLIVQEVGYYFQWSIFRKFSA